ncbi:MAG: hypothetical protein U0X20_27090 [Caldilineaceae bacterium]
MEPVSAAAVAAGTVAALWAALELVGSALVQGIGQEATRPWTEMFNDWLLDKTGVKERQRRTAFNDAYRSAEQTLMERVGKRVGYQTSQMVANVIRSPDKGRQLLLVMLEEGAEPSVQDAFAPYRILVRGTEEDYGNLRLFMLLLRANLFQTKEYQSIIQFCDMEQSRQIRQRMLQHLERLSQTVDVELQAQRITIVKRQDFTHDRALYLQQVQHHYQEQDFVGFPDLREQGTPVLLNSIFVPLKLQKHELRPTTDWTQAEQGHSKGDARR